MLYCREPSTMVHSTSTGSNMLPTQAPPPAIDFATAVQGNGYYPDEVVADWLRDDLLGKTEPSDLPPSRKRRRTLAPPSAAGHGSDTILFDRHTPPESSSHVAQPVIPPVARSLRQRRVSGSLVTPGTVPAAREHHPPAPIRDSQHTSTAQGEPSYHRRHRRPTFRETAPSSVPPSQQRASAAASQHMPSESFFFAPNGVSASSLYPDALGFPLVSGACPYAHSAAAAAYSYAPLPAHHPPVPGRVWPQVASSSSSSSAFSMGLSPWSFMNHSSGSVPTTSYLPHHQHGSAAAFACSQVPQSQHHPLHGPHNCMLSSLGLNYQIPSTQSPRNPSSTSSSRAAVVTNDRTSAHPFNVAPVEHTPINRNLPSRRSDYNSSPHRHPGQPTSHGQHPHMQQQQNVATGGASNNQNPYVHRRPSLWHHPGTPAPSSHMPTVSSTLAAAQTAAALHFAQTPDVSILLQFLTMIQQPRDQLFMSPNGGPMAGSGVRDNVSAGVPLGLGGSSATGGHHHSHHQHTVGAGVPPLNPHHLAAAGTNMETLFHLAAQLENRRRGLSKEELEVLPTWRFKPRNDSTNATTKKGKQELQQTKCMVCLEDFELKQTIRVLACSHEYHSKCVDRWLKNNRTCPMCRADAHDGTHQEEYF